MSFLSKPIESFANWMSPHAARKKHVYQFKEGSLEDRDILSSKGAHICELARTAGMPAPKGFILSTEASLQFEDNDSKISDEFFGEIVRAVAEMERETGKKFGVSSSATDSSPLLLCLRSGALVSVSEQAHSSVGAPESWKVPGVMNTLLGVGFSDEVLDHLCKSWNEKSALNAYAHFLMTYGMLICGATSSRYHNIIRQISHSGFSARVHAHGTEGGAVSGETGTGSACPGSAYEFTVDDLRAMIIEFKKIQSVPSNAYEQLKDALTKLYSSWFSDVSVTYRDNLDMYRGSGIAVIISEQILGGSGLCSTRNPVSGDPGLCGFFWPEASGQKVDMDKYRENFPENYQLLEDARKVLESKFRDMQDIEFATDAKDRLWILNSMPGHRRPAASVRIAKDMISENLLTERLALAKIDPMMISSEQLRRGGAIDESCADMIAGTGVAASDGIVTGHLAFSLDDVMNIVASGKQAVLCRDDCDVNDIGAIKLSSAVITVRGTATSSTAIFCRGLNKVCVTGITTMSLRHIQGVEGVLTAKGAMRVHDEVTVNGTTGAVYAGAIKWTPSIPAADFEYIMNLTDKYRKLQVFSYAKSLADCQRAIENHADGVALLKTDWMFTDGMVRLDLVRTLLFASEPERRQRSEELEALLCADFKRLFRLASTLEFQKPVIIQLFDNDFEEFLPESESEMVDLATRMNLAVRALKATVTNFRYQARHSGVCGHRAYALFPDLIRIQVRALIKASVDINTELDQASRGTEEKVVGSTEPNQAAGPFSPGAGSRSDYTDGSSRIMPLLSLPMTTSWEEVDHLVDIVKAVAGEFIVGDIKDIANASPNKKGVTSPAIITSPTCCSDVLRYGLLVGTPRACIDIEDFLSNSVHDDVAFITFHGDLITQGLYGMTPIDFTSVSVAAPCRYHVSAPRSASIAPKRQLDPFSPVSASPSAFSPDRGSAMSGRTESPCKRKLYSSERNPFEHLDEVGVGHLLESTVRACRAVKRRGDNHLKLGIISDAVCSDPVSIRFFNALDINYIGCLPERTEMTCLGAAQAQIQRSATGSSAPPPSVSDPASDWYHPHPSSIGSMGPSGKEPFHSTRLWASWDAPFVRYWKQAEKESGEQGNTGSSDRPVSSSSSDN